MNLEQLRFYVLNPPFNLIIYAGGEGRGEDVAHIRIIELIYSYSYVYFTIWIMWNIINYNYLTLDHIDPTQNLQVTAVKLSAPEGFVPGTASCSITALGKILCFTILKDCRTWEDIVKNLMQLGTKIQQ